MLLAGQYNGKWTADKWAAYKKWAALYSLPSFNHKWRYLDIWADCMD